MVDLATKTSLIFLVSSLHLFVIDFQMHQFWLDTLKDWKKMNDFSETHFMKLKSLKLLIAQLLNYPLQNWATMYFYFLFWPRFWTHKTVFTYSDKLVIPLFFALPFPTPLLILRHSVASPNPAFHNYSNR